MILAPLGGASASHAAATSAPVRLLRKFALERAARAQASR
jgi:hypothetical protein